MGIWWIILGELVIYQGAVNPSSSARRTSKMDKASYNRERRKKYSPFSGASSMALVKSLMADWALRKPIYELARWA